MAIGCTRHWLISTQVDGNWGVHAEIPKAMFEATA